MTSKFTLAFRLFRAPLRTRKGHTHDIRLGLDINLSKILRRDVDSERYWQRGETFSSSEAANVADLCLDKSAVIVLEF